VLNIAFVSIDHEVLHSLVVGRLGSVE
jgi:hypothetical protein